MRKIVRCSIGMALVLALVHPLPLAAQEQCGNAWRPVDAATGQITDIAALEQLVRDFPDSGSVRLRLMTALLEADRAEEAVAVAQALVERGYSFGNGVAAMLQGYGATPQWRADNRNNGLPVIFSELVAEVPADALLVESVWSEDITDTLFATSVVSRGLFMRQGEGEWRPVALDQAGSLSGMAIDPEEFVLWVASGVTEVTPDPESAYRGLIAIDPFLGIELRRVAGSPGSNPSDLAVASGGTIYVSDPVAGAIYRAGRTSERLETVLPPGTLRSPQGLVVLDDGRLVVSDYRYGLALVDPANGCVARLISEQPVLLDGIDGLWRQGQTLFGVQNGTRPMRIVALRLSADSTTITALNVLEQAHPEWTEPLGGSLDGQGLLYVATGQWERFNPGGSLAENATPAPTQVRRLPLVSEMTAERP